MTRASSFQIEHDGCVFVGRPFDQEHIPEILEIERVLFTDPWPERLFQEASWVEDHRWNFMLMDGDEVAAYAINWVSSGEIHLLNFGVRPDLQCRGLGRKFLQWLMEEGLRYGDTIFMLEVRASNERARRLYEGEGLNVVLKREGYYPDTDEDAFVMMRFLRDSIEDDE